MFHAFEQGFKQGYDKIIGVGTDIPDLNADIMNQGFTELAVNDTVFGPAEDGGYYLIGMTKLLPFIFENKPWSTPELLDLTIREIKQKEYSTEKLIELNDIDTVEDLEKSSIAQLYSKYLETIK